MYSFVTIRCSWCGAVMYNLPQNKIDEFEHFNLVCEDCVENGDMKNSFIAEKVETFMKLTINQRRPKYEIRN